MTKTFLSPQSKVVVNAHRTHDKKFGQKVRLLLTLVGVICPIHSGSLGNNVGKAPYNIHCLIFCIISCFMNTDELHASVCIREREGIKSLSSGTRVTLVIYATFADLG